MIPFVIYSNNQPLGRIDGDLSKVGKYISIPERESYPYVMIAFPSGYTPTVGQFVNVWGVIHERVNESNLSGEERVYLSLFRKKSSEEISIPKILYTPTYPSTSIYPSYPSYPSPTYPSYPSPTSYSSTPAYPSTLKEHLEELVELYVLAREEYKAKAFRTALKHIDTGISKGTKGVGESVMSEIEEFSRRGTSTRLEELRRRTALAKPYLELFRESVYGIGVVTAMKFYNMGCRTLEDLGGMDLTHAQRAGLRWYHDIRQRIPRSEIDEYLTQLTDTLGSTGNLFIIAGSYRRGEVSSGDIDILMRNDRGVTLSYIHGILLRSGMIIETLGLGDKKFLGIVMLRRGMTARRMDIRLFSPETWAYALLYNTGSQQFNILCRQRAIELELHLNDYTLVSTRTGAVYYATIEEEIFKHLRIAYLSPEQRADRIERY